MGNQYNILYFVLQKNATNKDWRLHIYISFSDMFLHLTKSRMSNRNRFEDF